MIHTSSSPSSSSSSSPPITPVDIGDGSDSGSRLRRSLQLLHHPPSAASPSAPPTAGEGAATPIVTAITLSAPVQRRVATFTTERWFGQPLALHPALLARMGYRACSRERKSLGNDDINIDNNKNNSSGDDDSVSTGACLQCEGCAGRITVRDSSGMGGGLRERFVRSMVQRLKRDVHRGRCVFRVQDQEQEVEVDQKVAWSAVHRKTAVQDTVCDTVVRMVERLVEIGYLGSGGKGDGQACGGGGRQLVDAGYMEKYAQREDVKEVWAHLMQSSFAGSSHLSLVQSCLCLAMHFWTLKPQQADRQNMDSLLHRTSLILYCPHCMMDHIITASSRRKTQNVNPFRQHRWWCPCICDFEHAGNGAIALWKQLLDRMTEHVRAEKKKEKRADEQRQWDSTGIGTEKQGYKTAHWKPALTRPPSSKRDEYDVWRSVRDILNDSLSPGFLKKRDIRMELIRERKEKQKEQQQQQGEKDHQVEEQASDQITSNSIISMPEDNVTALPTSPDTDASGRSGMTKDDRMSADGESVAVLDREDKKGNEDVEMLDERELDQYFKESIDPHGLFRPVRPKVRKQREDEVHMSMEESETQPLPSVDQNSELESQDEKRTTVESDKIIPPMEEEKKTEIVEEEEDKTLDENVDETTPVMVEEKEKESQETIPGIHAEGRGEMKQAPNEGMLTMTEEEVEEEIQKLDSESDVERVPEKEGEDKEVVARRSDSGESGNDDTMSEMQEGEEEKEEIVPMANEDNDNVDAMPEMEEVHVVMEEVPSKENVKENLVTEEEEEHSTSTKQMEVDNAVVAENDESSGDKPTSTSPKGDEAASSTPRVIALSLSDNERRNRMLSRMAQSQARKPHPTSSSADEASSLPTLTLRPKAASGIGTSRRGGSKRKFSRSGRSFLAGGMGRKRSRTNFGSGKRTKKP